MKMWVVFSVRDRLKYIGHLDLMRFMQRALRRAGLPVRYSQGFNPHILLSFAAPLPVGTEGLREVMEVPLSEAIAPAAFVEQLNLALPPLIRCQIARLVEDSQTAPMAVLAAAQFQITPLEQADVLLAAVPVLAEREQYLSTRKGKRGISHVDIRPLIYNMVVRDNALYATLALHPSGTCKPAQLIAALCEIAGLEEAPACAVVRTALLTQTFAPLEQA
jgi:radical SAM-linked protein